MVEHLKIKSRTLFLWGGVALIIIAARPAWNRVTAHLALKPIRDSLRAGELDKALQQLEGLQDAGRHRAEVAYLTAVTNRRLGNLQAAFQDLQQAEDLGWPLEEVTRQRYMARFQSGDFAGTQEYLQGFLMRGAEDDIAEEIYEALAKGFLAQFRIGDARVVLDHWLDWRPTALQALRWRAELYEQDEDWHRVAEFYQRIIDLRPDDLEARLRLGDAVLQDNNVEGALAQYREAYRRYPDDVLSRLGIALCERRLGRSEKAVELLEGVLTEEAESPVHGQVHAELGQIAMESSDFKRAAEHFEASLRLDPWNSRVYDSLGRTYAILGKEEEAKRNFDISKDLVDKHRRMLEAVTEAAKRPEDIEIRYEIAELLVGMGNREEAFRWLMTVINLNPNHVKAQAMLAQLAESELAKQDAEPAPFSSPANN